MTTSALVALVFALATQTAPTAAEEPAPVEPAPAESPATGNEPPPAAPAPALLDAPPAESAAVPPRPRLTRVAVIELAAEGLPPRLTPLFTAALVSELRKLSGLSVVGMDEVKQLLDVEATRQSLGCRDDGCSAELADALGVDVVVASRAATIGAEHVLSLRRLDAATAQTRGFDKRYAAGNGEELLAAIAPAVETLFPDASLRPGEARGVAPETGRYLNPPPVPTWLFATSAGITGGVLVLSLSSGFLSRVLTDSVQARVDDSVSTPTSGATLKRDFDAAHSAALLANVGFIVGAVGIAGTAVLGLFTDFWGYGE